jgi:hypothetical protein
MGFFILIYICNMESNIDAHFFDLSSLIKIKAKVWIVSKIKPSIPIIKIDESEFNLIKKSIWLNNGEKLKIGGIEYWLPINLVESLKIKCKKMGVELSDLSFSLQEFMNPEIIERLDFEIFTINFDHLKNTKDDVYIICSKNTKKNSQSIIEKLEEKLAELGIVVKNYYFISETFFNRDSDEISFKKTRLVIQHLIGLKTDNYKFTEEEITKYNKIFVYENSKSAIHELKLANDTLELLKENSEPNVKSIVDERLLENPTIIINEITFNKVNKFIVYPVEISKGRIVKTYESFIKRL